MLKQTSVYNVSFHPHAKFESCLLKFDAVCTVSAFSLVQGYNTRSFVLRTIVVHSYLERCPCLSRTVPVGGCRSRPNCGRMKFVFSQFLQFFILCDCRVDSRLVTIAHPLAHPVLLLCGFPSWWRCRFQGCAEIVIQLSVQLRVAHCCAFFFLVSSISVHGSERERNFFTCAQ